MKVVHEETPLTALCAGYELSKWRAQQLANHLVKWLPEFALTYEERKSIGDHNAVELIERAARTVYATEKYGKRGEFGELLLHVVLRQEFGTLPAISKLYYKDGPNETVKGFDCVHVVPAPDGLELWLGETKFYSDIHKAISDVLSEIDKHVQRDYLRNEFIAITNKLDSSWPRAGELLRLLHPNTSLDRVFKRAVLPVLLTYDSPVTSSHVETCPEYLEALKAEVSAHHTKFSKKLKELNLPLRVEFILIPLATKKDLQARLDRRLRGLQGESP